MNQKDFIIQMLPLVMRYDKRLWFHTLKEVETDIWEHVDKYCPLCAAEYIIESYPQGDTCNKKRIVIQ